MADEIQPLATPVISPASFTTPPARPTSLGPILAAWGQDVHDLTFGLAAPAVTKVGTDSQAGYPLGVSMVATCDASWGGGCFTILTIRAADGFAFQLRIGVQGATYFIRTWVSSAWTAWVTMT